MAYEQVHDEEEDDSYQRKVPHVLAVLHADNPQTFHPGEGIAQ